MLIRTPILPVPEILGSSCPSHETTRERFSDEFIDSYLDRLVPQPPFIPMRIQEYMWDGKYKYMVIPKDTGVRSLRCMLSKKLGLPDWGLGSMEPLRPPELEASPPPQPSGSPSEPGDSTAEVHSSMPPDPNPEPPHHHQPISPGSCRRALSTSGKAAPST